MDQESNFSLKKKNLILVSSIVGLVLCTINMMFGFRLLNPNGRSYNAFGNNYYDIRNQYVGIPIAAITASILGIFSNIFGVICAFKFPSKCLIILCVISSVCSSFANLAQLIVVISSTASTFVVPCTILSSSSSLFEDSEYKCPGKFLVRESALTSNLVFICMVFLLASLELGKSITMAILGCKQSCQMSNNVEIMPSTGGHQRPILEGQPQLHADASQPPPNYVRMAQHQATAALPATSQIQASRITAELNEGSNASQAPFKYYQ